MIFKIDTLLDKVLLTDIFNFLLAKFNKKHRINGIIILVEKT